MSEQNHKTVEEKPGDKTSARGVIHQIIGPVIDVKFEQEHLPSLLNAVIIRCENGDIVAEVAQHIGDDVVRCVALA
ncbi:MAG: hypothetical protein LBT52_01965, partial [Clostridiales Family XIII bacterium]|nr:hypothetical protein [Clostridiales Family XIII bacterium]